MRISDLSSDVCSSDLGGPDAGQPAAPDPAPDHPLRHFRGYDGNNESKFMAFAAYTVPKLGRFEYVKLARNNYWNSHMPMRPISPRMLAVWREPPAGKRLALDAAQAARVRAAGAPPEPAPRTFTTSLGFSG